MKLALRQLGSKVKSSPAIFLSSEVMGFGGSMSSFVIGSQIPAPGFGTLFSMLFQETVGVRFFYIQQEVVYDIR